METVTSKISSGQYIMLKNDNINIGGNLPPDLRYKGDILISLREHRLRKSNKHPQLTKPTFQTSLKLS